MSIPQRFLPPMAALRIFEAASRHKNFTMAAEELNLTQSAVSRQIRALEDILGAELFVRDGKTVQLTRAGETYAKDIRNALKRISNASLGFRANPQGGTLNIATLPTFGTRWLAPRLPAFIAQHPGMTINLSTRQTQFDFQIETFDAAIHFGLPNWSGAELDFLMGEMVIPVCSPQLLTQYKFVNYADLLKAPLLHLVSRPDAWEQWFRSMHVPIEELNGMLVDQFALAAEATIAGLGIALLPHFLIEKELRNGDLVPAINGSLQSMESYYLAWEPELVNYPPLLAFRTWLKETITSEIGIPRPVQQLRK